MDNIKEWTHLSYVDCVRKADDRESWRSMTVNLLGADDAMMTMMMIDYSPMASIHSDLIDPK